MQRPPVITRPGRPPGPRGELAHGTLVRGSLPDFADHPLDFLLDVARTYGDLASYRFGPKWRFLVNHPDLIEQVLVTDARNYRKHFGTRILKPILGNGLLTNEGEFWLRQRRLAQPTFLKNRVLSYAPVMAELTARMLAGWSEGQRVDMQFEFAGLASAIALKTLFGLDDACDRKAFTDALRESLQLLGKKVRTLLPFPIWIPTPTNLRIRRAIAQLDTVLDRFIAAGGTRKEPGDDLLSRLLAARDEDGSAMTDRQLRDEMMTLYVAGHETTAIALTWTWFLLAVHSQAEASLVAEWESVLGGRAPTAEDLPRLPFTEAVILESMRMYPPAFLIGREATCELQLGGYRVRKGDTVIISQWVSHRDPRYFPEPESFRPERWIDGLAQRLPRYAYFPFGGGPRGCIGQTFAMIELPIVLATVGQGFRFTVDLDAAPVPEPQMTLLPRNGMPAVLNRRQTGTSLGTR
jgi:cytochrome P450